MADNPPDYSKIKDIIKSGHEVALKNEFGIIYAYLQIDEIDNIEYVYNANG